MVAQNGRNQICIHIPFVIIFTFFQSISSETENRKPKFIHVQSRSRPSCIYTVAGTYVPYSWVIKYQFSQQIFPRIDRRRVVRKYIIRICFSYKTQRTELKPRANGEQKSLYFKFRFIYGRECFSDGPIRIPYIHIHTLTHRHRHMVQRPLVLVNRFMTPLPIMHIDRTIFFFTGSAIVRSCNRGYKIHTYIYNIYSIYFNILTHTWYPLK